MKFPVFSRQFVIHFRRWLVAIRGFSAACLLCVWDLKQQTFSVTFGVYRYRVSTKIRRVTFIFTKVNCTLICFWHGFWECRLVGCDTVLRKCHEVSWFFSSLVQALMRTEPLSAFPPNSSSTLFCDHQPYFGKWGSSATFCTHKILKGRRNEESEFVLWSRVISYAVLNVSTARFEISKRETL